MLTKKWQLADPMPSELVRRYKGMSAILAQVLYNRGFHTPEEATKFLSIRKLERNPFQMKGVAKAVSRIRQAIKKKEKIAIYGDYDADGVTSTALMVQTLRAFDADVMAYIPNRFDEGYGLNIPALEELASQGIKLVVTVDCGIRSIQEVEAGKAAGLDIIVTDHHSIGPEIPKALAVINPKQEDCPYPEKMLAGVGVAFRLAQALLRASAKNGLRPHHPIVEQDLLDLVAIGTVADIMPLNHLENRVLVRAGLEVIKRTNRFGIKALLEVAGIKPENVDTTTIGFIIGPRINAAGRLDSAMLAVDLLLAATEEEAYEKAQSLNDLNQQRQKYTREARDLIDAQISDELEHGLPLIFAGDDSLPEGIVGLVAGRLTES
ncbi:MAG: single-stranded-DNA-specific exonuclease RecJ, partial [Chloroflexi bacterium]